LSTSAVRWLSVTSGTPPASSIFMVIDVPERGSPETTMTGCP
jgi:hypothetical protein